MATMDMATDELMAWFEAELMDEAKHLWSKEYEIMPIPIGPRKLKAEFKIETLEELREVHGITEKDIRDSLRLPKEMMVEGDQEEDISTYPSEGRVEEIEIAPLTHVDIEAGDANQMLVMDGSGDAKWATFGEMVAVSQSSLEFDCISGTTSELRFECSDDQELINIHARDALLLPLWAEADKPISVADELRALREDINALMEFVGMSCTPEQQAEVKDKVQDAFERAMRLVE